MIKNKIRLNKTVLEVTPVCLGTAYYGSSMPEDVAMRQLDEYVEMGGNFIDTAHVYGNWEPGDGPFSERTIGKWLAKKRVREEIIISTKGACPDMWTMDVPRCSNADIQKDLEGSLKELQTDYVDLYFLHRDDPRRPVEEILDFLEEKVKEGKIRYYGCSNWSLQRIQAADAYASKRGIQGFSCNQLMWSLPEINAEGLNDDTLVLMDKEIYQYHKEQNKNVMAYTASARGYFAKRMAGDAIPKHVEDMYKNSVNDRMYEFLSTKVTEETSIHDYGLQYLQTQPFPVVPIISCSRSEQLMSAMHSIQADCDMEILRRIHEMKY